MFLSPSRQAMPPAERTRVSHSPRCPARPAQARVSGAHLHTGACLSYLMENPTDQELGPLCLGFPRRAYVSVDIKYNNVPRVGIVILLFRSKLNLDSVWKDFSLLSEPALNHAVISFSTSR